MDDPRDIIPETEWVGEHALLCPGVWTWCHRTWWPEGEVGVMRCSVCGYETDLLLLRDDDLANFVRGGPPADQE